LEVTVELIKTLREETGAGIMECKRALEEAKGDLEGAREILRERGLDVAAKKAARMTNEGIVESYIHSGGQVGSLVEVKCETDFVGRTTDFKHLAHELAMQIAAMSPLYIDAPDIPDDDDSNPQEACLLQQPYIRDPSITIQDLINNVIGKVGENVRVHRFARFSLGE